MTLPSQDSRSPISTYQSKVSGEDSLSPAELTEIWARRAYKLAEEPPAPATRHTVNLLVFWLGSERFGIEVGNVSEIYPLEQLTLIPYGLPTSARRI